MWEGSQAYALEEAERSGDIPIEEDEHGAYILNSKDLCAIEYLQGLWEAGVSGMKVEGRTKSVYYLAHVGRAYRKTIDRILQGQRFDAAVLDDIYATANRGLMPGFLITVPEESRQNYETGHSTYSLSIWRNCAILSCRREDGEIEVKNQLQIGDRVEFVSARCCLQTLTALYDLNHQPLSAAHGGAKNILVLTEHEPAPFTLLRIPMTP